MNKFKLDEKSCIRTKRNYAKYGEKSYMTAQIMTDTTQDNKYSAVIYK